MTDTGWTITDHLCRVCVGRVLKRETAKGIEVRCSNCGHTATVSHAEESRAHQSICFCGVKPTGSGKVGMKCVRHDHPTPELPAEVVVVEA